MQTVGYFMRERVQCYGKPIANVMATKVGQHDEEAGDGSTRLYRFGRDVLRVEYGEHGGTYVAAYRAQDVAQAQRMLENWRTAADWPISNSWTV